MHSRAARAFLEAVQCARSVSRMRFSAQHNATDKTSEQRLLRFALRTVIMIGFAVQSLPTCQQ